MIDKIGDFLWRIAGLRTFIAALAVYLVFAGYVMPTGAAKIQQLSGKQIEILDLQFSYTPEKARAIISLYGDAAREMAADFDLVADTLYPVSYTFLFIIIISWLFKSLVAYGIKVRYIQLLPFCVMLADYGENFCIIKMLRTYPDFSDNLATVSSMFTSLKWSLLIVETLIICIALWIFIFYRMTRGKTVGSRAV